MELLAIPYTYDLEFYVEMPKILAKSYVANNFF